ncbi:MAG: hypothetical protein AABY22_02680 [Nanoarchaeota archaeon]
MEEINTLKNKDGKGPDGKILDMKQYKRNHYEINKEKIASKAKLRHSIKKNNIEYVLTRRLRARNFYKNNTEKILKAGKEYIKRNPDKVKKRRLKYYQKNKEYYYKKSKEWRRKNPEKIRLQSKTKYEKHGAKMRAKSKIYHQREDVKKRRNEISRIKSLNDPVYRLEKSIRSNMAQGLNKIGEKKNNRSWVKFVDYSLDDLKEHLESQFADGMNWDNYNKGEKKWNIDHILPIKVFTYKSSNDPQFKTCWDLKNLRPMWRDDNIIKSDFLSNGKRARYLTDDEKLNFLNSLGHNFTKTEDFQKQEYK